MDAAVTARISRAARRAGRLALERRTEVNTVRCGSPGQVQELRAGAAAGPHEVGHQGHRISGFDQPDLGLQVGGLKADVGLEAGAPAGLLGPVPGGRPARFHHPGQPGGIRQRR